MNTDQGRRDIVEKLEFGCPFKINTIGEKNAELAEVIMQEGANEIKRLRQLVMDLHSCKFEPDKLQIMLEREVFVGRRDIYRAITPFDCK